MTGLAGSDKPGWAKLILEARRLEKVVAELHALAGDLRCSAEDSTGARCTLDVDGHVHHRHEREDLP